MAAAGLHWIDGAIIVLYFAFAVGVGLVMRERASASTEEYFLSGRSLPWWLAGTSMVATSFASDTPLLVSGWVREEGIWRNWVWWCYAISGVITVFVFARWWRRAKVVTKAELTELRYGTAGARRLRAFLGVYQAAVANPWILVWVMLSASKILEVLFGLDRTLSVTIACLGAVSYSLLAGFWGVVITDLVQFVLAAVGAVALAVISWRAVGGLAAVEAAVGPDSSVLALVPTAEVEFGGSGASYALAALAVYLGVSWWAHEDADGSPVTVQRISACADERQGMLAALWYAIAHYALRPWPWIVVGLASLVVLPALSVPSPVDGQVVEVDAHARVVAVASEDTGERVEVPLVHAEEAPDWRVEATVSVGDAVSAGEPVASVDAERAYVVMLRRYLPTGLLGVVAVSLLAAFMSTVDTHVNLAAAFFVNDVYRPHLRPEAEAEHYVRVARWASVATLVLAAVAAWQAESVRWLFEFFLAFLAGVGPIYLLRWLWWRISATTEIVACVASAATALTVTFAPIPWAIEPLSASGALLPIGRTVVVTGVSLVVALGSLALTARPEPAALVEFYARVRPFGWWGPVRALAPEASGGRRGTWTLAVGIVGALALIYGLLFGTGAWLLERPGLAVFAAVAGLGGVLVAWSVRAIEGERE